ncbi:MAG TPA: 4a-hydroxytetrahydrobiopterin dehydratase [Thermoanaerobaculia bacterium]|nr:4a-hydroxytetrahydrobiopterin dehydratase [Thermoanaerobaculia bacterium]
MLQSVEASVLPSSGWTLMDLLRQIPGLPGDHFLKPERVQEELRLMPGWRGIVNFRAIDQVRRFPSEEVASAFASYVKVLAEESGQLCSVAQALEHVTVTLTGRHPGGCVGITRAVLDFAKRLG